MIIAACDVGYYGGNCKPCPPGFFGAECGGLCSPGCADENCNHVIGCLIDITTQKVEQGRKLGEIRKLTICFKRRIIFIIKPLKFNLADPNMLIAMCHMFLYMVYTQL